MYLRFFTMVLIGLSFTGVTKAGNNLVNKTIHYNEGQLAPTNYIKNPSCTINVSNFISASGTTLTKNTTNPIAPGGDCQIDTDSKSDAITWDVNDYYDTARELENQNCEASITYTGDASTATLQVIRQNIDTNAESIINSVVLNSSSSTEASLQVPCGTLRAIEAASGAYQHVTTTVRVWADNDTPVINVGRVYYGKNRKLGTVAQAIYNGGVSYDTASGCQWSASSATTTSLGVDTDCPTPTTYGNALAPTTKVSGIRFATMEEGTYQFVVNGDFYSTSNTVGCTWSISDGTDTIYLGSVHQTLTGERNGPGAMTGHLNQIGTRAESTWSIYSAGTDGTSTTCRLSNNDTNSKFMINVIYFPSKSKQITSTDKSGWYIDVNIGGASVDLGLSNQSSYVVPSDSGLDMVINTSKGSASAGIPCSTTNDNNVGRLTCSSGSEQPGVIFNAPNAGAYEACIGFTHSTDTGASGSVSVTFQLVETENGSQTIIQEGGNRTNNANPNSSTLINWGTYFCSNFYFSSSGKKTIRLAYEQSIIATVDSNILNLSRTSSIGQRDMYIVVKRINQDNSPKYVNMMSCPEGSCSQFSAEVRETAGTCSVVRQNGNWISLSSTVGTGNCIWNISGAGFTEVPWCNCTAYTSSAGGSCNFDFDSQTTATSISTQTYNGTSEVPESYRAILNCFGRTQ